MVKSVNMVTGVTKGYVKRLEINGVGYRAQVQGTKLVLNLGFSHPVEHPIPEGITIKMDEEKKNIIVIEGIDKQKVGQVASEIRGYRPPEPYKGKGIKYEDEYIKRKAGKTAGKGD
jgi:large subunit ribosomal protein L6